MKTKITVIHWAFEDKPVVAAFIETELIIDEGFNINSVLNLVYEATNTIDEIWYKESRMEEWKAQLFSEFRLGGFSKGRGGCRSTSTGDFLIVTYDDENVETYVVAEFGFKQTDACYYVNKKVDIFDLAI